MSSIQTLIGSRINVGLSATIGVTVQASLAAWQLKMVSGGTLEIGLTSGGGWGGGYVMQGGEIANVLGPGTFWLGASGATCTVHLLQGFNS